MGHLKEKYTEEYYTGTDKDGKNLGYGATSFLDNDGIYALRDHDKKILEKINFEGKNVLALGCGRGEELVYAIENGANRKDSAGVDFSSAAIRICRRVIKDKKIKSPQLFTEDALEFILRFQKEVKKNETKKIDIVIMLDFMEHVPRPELLDILMNLKKIIKKNAILAVNTPAYRYDNDVIKNGYDERNNVDIYDTSDDRPETKGMHCNKYSATSLQKFMIENGFINLSEAHYFVNSEIGLKDFDNMSYYHRWMEAIKRGVPIAGEYSDDVLERPYVDLDNPELYKFKKGNLSGISISVTEMYRDLAYPDGNTDAEMMSSMMNMDLTGKVIFDVGVFVGVCSMLFSKMVGKNGSVIGFEPNPSNRNRTFLNLSHNTDLSSNVAVYEYALGSENKVQNMLLSLRIDNGYSSTSRLEGSHSTIHGSDLPDSFEDAKVEVKTLDTFVDESGILPDVLKVDIEGAEYDFLLGAARTIRKVHPIFYMELHSQYCAVKCAEFLIIEGYSIKVLHEEDDNRVMILAEYTNESRGEANIEAMKSLDTAFSTLKNMSDNLATFNKDIQSKDRQICDLVEENSQLRIEKARIDASEAINDILSARVQDIELSKSWMITKPLRKAANILRSIKK